MEGQLPINELSSNARQVIENVSLLKEHLESITGNKHNLSLLQNYQLISAPTVSNLEKSKIFNLCIELLHLQNSDKVGNSNPQIDDHKLAIKIASACIHNTFDPLSKTDLAVVELEELSENPSNLGINSKVLELISIDNVLESLDCSLEQARGQVFNAKMKTASNNEWFQFGLFIARFITKIEESIKSSETAIIHPELSLNQILSSSVEQNQIMASAIIDLIQEDLKIEGRTTSILENFQRFHGICYGLIDINKLSDISITNDSLSLFSRALRLLQKFKMQPGIYQN